MSSRAEAPGWTAGLARAAGEDEDVVARAIDMVSKARGQI
jgi:hypothetical protein